MKHYRFRLEGKGVYDRPSKFTGDLYPPFRELRIILSEELGLEESDNYLINNSDTRSVDRISPKLKLFKRTVKMGRDFKTPSEDFRIALDYSRELEELEENGAMRVLSGKYELRGEIWTDKNEMLEQIRYALLDAFMQDVPIERIPADISMLRPTVIQSTTIPQKDIVS